MSPFQGPNVVVPGAQSTAGGFILGPPQNTFTGPTLTEAADSRDVYAILNPTWLDTYDMHGIHGVHGGLYYVLLEVGSVATPYVRQASSWVEVGGYVTGPAGPAGTVPSLLAGNAPVVPNQGPYIGSIGGEPLYGAFGVPLDTSGDPDEALIRTMFGISTTVSRAAEQAAGYHTAFSGALYPGRFIQYDPNWSGKRVAIFGQAPAGNPNDMELWLYDETIGGPRVVVTDNYFLNLGFVPWTPLAPIFRSGIPDEMQFWITPAVWPDPHGFDDTGAYWDGRFVNVTAATSPYLRFATFKDTAQFVSADFDTLDGSSSWSYEQVFGTPSIPTSSLSDRAYMGCAHPVAETWTLLSDGANRINDFGYQAAQINLAGHLYKVIASTGPVLLVHASNRLWYGG